MCQTHTHAQTHPDLATHTHTHEHTGDPLRISNGLQNAWEIIFKCAAREFSLVQAKEGCYLTGVGEEGGSGVRRVSETEVKTCFIGTLACCQKCIRQRCHVKSRAVGVVEGSNR